jgi:hypothetical protein
MRPDDDGPTPPQPAQVPRRLHLYGAQWIGLPLIMLIPVVALFGVFDEQRALRHAESAVLEVGLEYPSRLRYQQDGHLLAQVRNRSAHSLTGVRVMLDSSYARSFEGVRYTPPPVGTRHVTFDTLPPGGTQSVRVDLTAQSYWRQRGALDVVTGGGDSLRIVFTTFVLP